MASQWLTWANLLSLSRTALIVPFTWLLLQEYWLAAAVCFALAVVSDIYDGKLARKYNQVSQLGGLLDHGTDALFVTCGCAALAVLGLINPILPILIPLAFLQYMLDSRALAGHALRTSLVGKVNGVCYFVVVGVVVGAELLGWRWLLLPAAVFAWLLVASTCLSMLDRALTYWRTRNPENK